MNRFYFNECLPEKFEGSVQSVFDKTIKEFNRISKDQELNIDEGIITHKMPSEILVCGKYLNEIIASCEDNTVKRLSYRYFTKYPIDVFFEIEDIFDLESIDMQYEFDSKDAINLVVAYKSGWYLLSLPLSDSLTSDTLPLKSNDKYLYANNWHGLNTPYIIKCIAEDTGVRQDKIRELKFSFGNKECLISDSFIAKYKYSPVNLQQLIIEKFKDAISARLLFPAKHDDNLIKNCKGVGNEDLFELRSDAFGGLRVYFSCYDESIYLGGMNTKSSSVGKEQSADICRASNEIKKMKSNL